MMLIIFFYYKGVVHKKLMPQGVTVYSLLGPGTHWYAVIAKH